MALYYCEYCGAYASSIANLTMGLCPKHPMGGSKGHHKLYEGSEKKEYFCKYCGTKTSSIANLTNGLCPRHPAGPSKGRHSPAL